MLDRRADIGILVDMPQVDGLRCQPLATEAMYFCRHDPEGWVLPLLRAPAGADGDAATCGEPGRLLIDFVYTTAQPLEQESRRYSIRQRVEEAAVARGVALNIVHEHDEARVIRSLHASSAGLHLHTSMRAGRGPVDADPRLRATRWAWLKLEGLLANRFLHHEPARSGVTTAKHPHFQPELGSWALGHQQRAAVQPLLQWRGVHPGGSGPQTR